MDQAHIRNFCIIAHIDHGKSTLADRLLELTGTVEKRQMREQLLDRMDLERERGITIKLAPVRMTYRANESRITNHESRTDTEQKTDAATRDSQFSAHGSKVEYQLNLIDTPGHVDFSYEVSRSLAACEGALLVVDAAQGIQAQTLANVYLALAADLTIIPVLNKIDLPAADIERVSAEVVSLLGCRKEDILLISAKTGQGIEQVLERIVKDVPSPKGQADQPTRALVFDSYFDDYRGVILYVRVVDGHINTSETIKMFATDTEGQALEVGYLSPENMRSPDLRPGEIGYIVTNLKSTHQAKVGDTVTLAANPATQALPGYKEVKPFVYAGFFPVSSDQYQTLKAAVERLILSDSALQYELENSSVLGFGVRIGFLGLLHMDIVRERLEREYNLELIITSPSTEHHVTLTNGSKVVVKSAAELPDAGQVAVVEEPWVKGEIVCPKRFVGAVMQLIINSRGAHKNLSYVEGQSGSSNDNSLAVVAFEAPLSKVLTDFYDQLKSLTSGYGSFSYELDDYQPEDLVRLDFYVANERVDALSTIVHRSEAESLGRSTVSKLKEAIPKQLFKVSLQAAIGGKFIAREDISPLKKDVTGHLYGGDVSRKKKLWAKQARGKARMKRFGKVDIPTDAFTVLLRRD